MRRGRLWPVMKNPLFSPNVPFNEIAPRKAYVRFLGNYFGVPFTPAEVKTEEGVIDHGTPALRWTTTVMAGAVPIIIDIAQTPMAGPDPKWEWRLQATDGMGSDLDIVFNVPQLDGAWAVPFVIRTGIVMTATGGFDATPDFKLYAVRWNDFP